MNYIVNSWLDKSTLRMFGLVISSVIVIPPSSTASIQ